MESDPYTQRELASHFEELGSKIDENTKLTKELNTKVGIQNGRVAKIEATAKGLMISGAIITILFGLIVSLTVYAFQISQQSLENKILLEIKK